MMTPRLVVVFFFLVTLGACSGNQFSYNAQKYPSARVAYDAQYVHIDSIAKDIRAVPQRISGDAVVITPSRTTIEALGMTRTGSPKRQFVEYVAVTTERDYESFSRYLDASGAFSTVDSMVVDFPQKDAREVRARYAATIYLHMKSPTQIGWFLLTPTSKSPKPISFDSLSAFGSARIDSWVQSIIGNLDASK